MNINFGMAIKSLRQQRGISQAGLGIAIGVSRAQIANWELERRELTLRDAALIAKYFNVSLDELISIGQ